MILKETELPVSRLKDIRDCFLRERAATWTHIYETSGDYSVEEEVNSTTGAKTLYLLFQESQGTEDNINNIDFPSVSYSDTDFPWKCHRGFLRVWKSIEPHISSYVNNVQYTAIKVIGYSHGAAIATLAHEYCWFHRPDLRDGDKLVGYGFGCPRCYYSGYHPIPSTLSERWANFYAIRNCNDIVTHLPFSFMGYRHVSNIVQIGSTIDWDNVEYSPYFPEFLKRLPRWMTNMFAVHFPQDYELALNRAVKAAENRAKNF